MLHGIDFREIFERAHLNFTVGGRSKLANIHMHVHNEVTLVWGSLRLAPITNISDFLIRRGSDILLFLIRTVMGPYPQVHPHHKAGSSSRFHELDMSRHSVLTHPTLHPHLPQLVACLFDGHTCLKIVHTAQNYMYIGPQHNHHISDLDWERTGEGRKGGEGEGGG